MQQSFLARKNLYESTELENADYLSVIYGTNLRDSNDTLNPSLSLGHSLSIVGSDIHNTHCALSVRIWNLIDRDCRTGLLLNLLDGLTTLSDDGSDKLGSNNHLLDTRNERLVVLPWCRDSLKHLSHNVQTSQTGLLKSLGKHFVAQSVNLDIHLGSGDTVSGTGYLEVHISEVVLISEDIGKDSVALVRTGLVGNKSHSNSGYRLLDLHTGIHKCEATAAH